MKSINDIDIPNFLVPRNNGFTILIDDDATRTLGPHNVIIVDQHWMVSKFTDQSTFKTKGVSNWVLIHLIPIKLLSSQNSHLHTDVHYLMGINFDTTDSTGGTCILEFQTHIKDGDDKSKSFDWSITWNTRAAKQPWFNNSDIAIRSIDKDFNPMVDEEFHFRIREAFRVITEFQQCMGF